MQKEIFKTFLLILCEFHASPNVLYLPSAFEKNKNKTNHKQNKWNHAKKHHIMDAVVFSTSHSILLCPYIFCCKCSLQWVIASHDSISINFSGFCHTRSILNPHQDASQLSCCCPVSSRAPATLYQQDQSFHMPQQFTDDVDFGVGQLKAPVLGLGGIWAGQPATSPSSGWALQHCSG